MKKITTYTFYAWSGLILLFGLENWVATMGVVRGSEYAAQITIVSCLSMIMVWLALFGVWFSLNVKPQEKALVLTD